jgi:hypothetical protein
MLAAAVAAVEAKNADKLVTYQYAINQLAAKVATLPEVVAMKSWTVSSIGTCQSNSSIYNDNGSIYTGYYKNWSSLKKEDKDLVSAECTKLGMSSNPKKFKTNKHDDKKVKKLTKAVHKLQCKVAAVKWSQQQTSNKDEEDSNDTSSVPEDAGNQFRGRAEKQKRRRRADY